MDKLAERFRRAGNLGVAERGTYVLFYKYESERVMYNNAPTGENTEMH